MERAKLENPALVPPKKIVFPIDTCIYWVLLSFFSNEKQCNSSVRKKWAFLVGLT